MKNYLYYDEYLGTPKYTATGAIIDSSYIEIPLDFKEHLTDFVVRDGVLVRISINSEREKVRNSILSEIGNKRSSLVTPIPFQNELYKMKEDEARRYIKDTDPNMNEYPLIKSEGEQLNKTYLEVANIYISKANTFNRVMSKLEEIRIKYNKELDEVNTLNTLKEIEKQFYVEIRKVK